MKYPKNLNPPHVILRRVLCILPLQLFRFLFCLVVLLGWGVDDAERMWKETE